MELDMIRNGHNFERRKMYPLNPRNNLISTIDISWTRSLEDTNKFSTSKIRNQNSQQKQQIKQHYNDLLDKKIQQQKSLDKSSFRVFPVHRRQLSQDTNNLSRFSSLHQSRSSLGDTTNFNRLQGHKDDTVARLTSKEILQPVTTVKHQGNKSGKMAQSLFGYEINPESYKRQSYLSKLLSDRLQPFLQHPAHHPHKSVMANQIINLNY